METTQIYSVISIVAVSIVILLVLFTPNKNSRRLSPLALFAFCLVVAGIIFGDNRFLGYGLMGIGVFVGFVDMVHKFYKNSKEE